MFMNFTRRVLRPEPGSAWIRRGGLGELGGMGVLSQFSSSRMWESKPTMDLNIEVRRSEEEGRRREEEGRREEGGGRRKEEGGRREERLLL